MRLSARAGLGVVMAAALLALATNAVADPPSGVTPAVTDVVGIGDQTDQGLLDQLALDYDAQSPVPTRKLYSFDATGSTTIRTKTGCASQDRPTGVGADSNSYGAIGLFGANQRPSGDSTDYCIDFVHSLRGPAGSDPTGLAFAQLAQDAVTWSATSTSAKPTHAPTTLSKTQLRAIYLCDASVLDTGKTGPVTWDEVGGTGTDEVVPVLPEAPVPYNATADNSDIRAFFFSRFLGIGYPGSCVIGQDRGSQQDPVVAQNEGVNAVFKGANSQDVIFPYSVADFLAQSQNRHGTGAQGNQVLRSVTNTANTAVPPTTGAAGSLTINPAFASTGLTRFIYDVVRDNGTSSHVPTYLQGIFGAGNDTGYFCTNATAQADIASFGFRNLGTSCGLVITH